jgi:tetratricopeptide (TPR) repeat protein
MKKIIFLLGCTISLLSVAGQSDSIGMRKHYLKVYNHALEYNDVNAAINALHNYLATDDNIMYKDTLSMLYFSVKSYYSSLLLAEEVYKALPSNYEAMARAGDCYDELGDPKTSVSLFEQVCPKTKNPYHYYKLALGQYQLKRVAECEASAKMVIADSNSKKSGINFQMADGTQQLIPVNAAAANLLGVMQMDGKNFELAKTYFRQALLFFPKFTGADQNLKVCEEQTKKAKTPPKTAPIKPKG